MGILAIIGITIFIVLLFSMFMASGTQESVSALAKDWKWLLQIALWSQVLLLPQLFEITPDPWKFVPFLGIAGILGCGAASVFNKSDELFHMICAAIAFTCFFGWVMIMNSYNLLAVVVCLAAGRDKWKLRLEIGLIISMYLTLLPYSI